MKLAAFIPLVLACAGAFTAQAVGGEAGASGLVQGKAIPTDRDRIVTEVLRLFLKDVSTPETAKRRFVGVVKIYYVHAAGEAHVNLQDFADDSYQLKASSGKELGRGGCIDEETRQPCAVVELSVVSIDGDVAIASVFWMQSALSGGGLDYQLRKKDGSWQILGIVGVSSI